MSSTYLPLSPACAEVDGAGRLFNHQYGDLYNGPKDALGQAEQVFLQGNGLPQRWQGRDSFTVCETGFGLGTNFLALWRAWRADPARSRRLHMLSIEGHPFSQQDYRRLCETQVPAPLRELARMLATQWPQTLPGLHRLEFDGGAVTLTLAFGDIARLVTRLSACVDAFFLDGFAPKVNPAMWEPVLLRRLLRLGNAQATLATWCSAGAVRRALQAGGFEIERLAGFQGKHHMTVGRRAAWAGKHAPVLPAWPEEPVVVVGAGLAGAGVAHALALRGVAVQVLAEGVPAHAGHLAAALTPLLARDDNSRARLVRAGSQRALRRWQGMAAVQRVGTLQLERDSGRQAALAETLSTLALPEQWVRWVEQDEAGRLAGLPLPRGGIYFADGLLVRPQALIDHLLDHPCISRRTLRVERLAPDGQGWQLLGADGSAVGRARHVVLANAIGAQSVLRSSDLLGPLPQMADMHGLAGEVCHVPAAAFHGGPRCVIGGEGYLLPALDGFCVAGSTYVPGAQHCGISVQGQAVNREKTAGLLGWAPEVPAGGWAGWAGWRAVVAGRLPVAGALPHAPGVWLASGYGSRGLTWSALLGDLIAAQLCGEPLPLEKDLLTAIAPR